MGPLGVRHSCYLNVTSKLVSPSASTCFPSGSSVSVIVTQHLDSCRSTAAWGHAEGLTTWSSHNALSVSFFLFIFDNVCPLKKIQKVFLCCK